MSTLSPSPDEAGTSAVKYEGWWMLVIPPLTLGVHALCSYYSAWSYCNVSTGVEPDSLPGMINAYTLVALLLLAGMAFWGYTRYRVDANVDSPRLKPRLEEVRNGLDRLRIVADADAGAGKLARARDALCPLHEQASCIMIDDAREADAETSLACQADGGAGRQDVDLAGEQCGRGH